LKTVAETNNFTGFFCHKMYMQAVHRTDVTNRLYSLVAFTSRPKNMLPINNKVVLILPHILNSRIPDTVHIKLTLKISSAPVQ